jgi:phytoene dehydrogenase-like protein
METKAYDVVIAGAGAAGLTCAAYLSREGRSVLLAEASDHPGGLVNSFDINGFLFDGGIRAFENSGIIFPMLRDLGIEIDFANNPVAIGIGDRFAALTAENGLTDYSALLLHVFPGSADDIAVITREIRRAVSYMEVLYGIDNPLFGDLLRDKDYLLRTLLPWLLRYQRTIRKTKKLVLPIYEHLGRLTSNKALIDMIAQHFFKNTPASFALSYFSQYLDYSYPRGGTGILARRLADKILGWGGVLRLGTRVTGVDISKHEVITASGEAFAYKKLVWACDLKALYACADTKDLAGTKAPAAIERQKQSVLSARTGDSILTIFVSVSRGAGFFDGRTAAHCFYTPDKTGLSSLSPWQNVLPEGCRDASGKDALKTWLAGYLALTTYEISIPVLRDDALAPPGSAGLIISTLLDYAFVASIREQGWYDEFKTFCTREIIGVLSRSAFPLDAASVTDALCATPLTLERLTGNSGGAVTGWAFTNKPLPVVSHMKKVIQAIRTPLPDVLQAGQWTFSPSGLPISVLTGKLAADAANQALTKTEGRSRL